ncbi:MAG: hypothetical protein ABI184_07885 [Ginsengibacter sp.]
MIWFLSGGKFTILPSIEGSPVFYFWFLSDYKIEQEENNGPKELKSIATSAKLHLTLVKS